MKKAKNIEIQKFADRVKQSLTSTYVPTYDWMYELGLSSSQLGVYAYIFNVCKREPMAEHCISTQDLCKTFHVTPANISYIVKNLINLGLISKRVEGKGILARTYYSLYQPA